MMALLPDAVAWAGALGDAAFWLVAPLVVAWRMRGSRSLDVEPLDVPADAPLVSVIVPARDEAHNIERCVRSVLAARYPALEVVVVDDHSADGTGDIARRVAAEDPRLRVVDNPALPDGWMGKQWACATGATHARGGVLLFADADTTHAPDLVPRAVNAMRARGADMLSVIGRQELGSFWERVVQPQVFAVIAGRFGSTERVNRSRRASDKIANGQCILVSREAYDAVGGHASVRDWVAEDLKLAQRFFSAGRRVTLVLGTEQLATRMYTSLGELVAGWRKNMFAGGREAMPLGRFGQLLFPLLLLVPPLMALAPLVALVLGAFGLVPAGLTLAAAIATAAVLVWALVVYGSMGVPLYAFTYPLGAGVLLWIVVQAVANGQRVSWKGRAYLSSAEP
jgi:chlorobactene glucosyltransferase